MLRFIPCKRELTLVPLLISLPAEPQFSFPLILFLPFSCGQTLSCFLRVWWFFPPAVGFISPITCCWFYVFVTVPIIISYWDTSPLLVPNLMEWVEGSGASGMGSELPLGYTQNDKNSCWQRGEMSQGSWQVLVLIYLLFTILSWSKCIQGTKLFNSMV